MYVLWILIHTHTHFAIYKNPYLLISFPKAVSYSTAKQHTHDYVMIQNPMYKKSRTVK